MNHHDELNESVSKLTKQLMAYRLSLENYMRRGARAFVAALLALLLVATLTVVSVLTMRDTQALVDRVTLLEERQLEDVRAHRRRNEILHACIADLLVSIVRTPLDAEERARLVNPCPEPILNGSEPHSEGR